MYAALFRLLPGPKWLKAIEFLLLLAGVIFVLFTWVFPWAYVYFGLSEQTVS